MAKEIAPFTLPVDGEVFTNDILERSEGLIDAGIWEGLDRVRLRTWMRNFSSAEEQYFAACILDALIYRSDAQTVAMMEQMFERLLPDHTREFPLPPEVAGDWLTRLRQQSRVDPGVRIVPVIRDTDPPTKSGTLMARMYRRDIGLNLSFP